MKEKKANSNSVKRIFQSMACEVTYVLFAGKDYSHKKKTSKVKGRAEKMPGSKRQ
jgi:hypothetical protein